MKNATKSLGKNISPQPMEQTIVEELVIRSQQGDEKAFNELYLRFYPIVHRRVWHLIPPADVDDITQEVFLSVIRSLKSFRGDAQFSTWLYTLTSRQVANYYRKRERTPKLTETDFEEYIDIFPAPATSLRGNHHDEILTIQHALSLLTSEYQNVILLRLVEEYKFKEIAELLGKSLDATKSLFRRALIALQQEVETE